MTIRETPCDAAVEALLDPSRPRPAGLDAHLEACPTCRRLRDATRAAERLAAPPPPRPPAIRVDEVEARVRSRRRARAAVAAATTAACAVLALALLARGPAPRQARGDDLFALVDSVDGYARREVALDDPALRGAAPLAGWLAPPPRRSFDLPSLAPTPHPGESAGGTEP